MDVPERRRSTLPVTMIGVSLAALLATLTWLGSHYQLNRELALAEEAIAAGQPADAWRRLDRLSWLGVDDPELRFLEGACAESEGDMDAAFRAWSSIPEGTSRWGDAVIRRARLALARGRYADVEAALSRPFPAGHRAVGEREQLLLQLLLFTVRYDEIARHKEISWSQYRDPKALRIHWMVDEARSFPVDATRDRLDLAGRDAPEDDRVWLGKANLAIRTGDAEEARTWLRRCLGRRPEDQAVWRARLDWAVTFDQLGEAIEAARHLTADSLSPTRVLATRAWVSARRGDIVTERATLEELLDREPGNTTALIRLAELAARDGLAARVVRLRELKAEVDQASDAYRALLTEDPYLQPANPTAQDPAGREATLARHAERLGRWFEARGWWTLALSRPTDRAEARRRLEQLDGKAREREAAPLARRIAHARRLVELLADEATPEEQPPGRAKRDSLAVPEYRDRALEAGLAVIYRNDPTPRCRMPETMGGGVGLIDFDGDGRQDVYAVQGGTFPNDPGEPAGLQRDRLYRNEGDGTFRDVTAPSGLAAFSGGYGHGVTVGDYDDDGHPDLFVTRWRSYALYHNEGDGTFADVTTDAGLGGPRDWPTSAAFADLEGDGDLDLYVCHYAAWDPQTSNPCPHASRREGFMYCGPRTFEAMPDHVFRNDRGRFVDVSMEAGITAADREGRGLGVVAADLDDDGDIDLFVANDLTANFLFRNEGGFRFREVGMEAGVGSNADGGFLAGMGIACGDLDGDGRIDLAVTNFYGEATTLYKNLGGGQFADRTAAAGLSAATRYRLGFGTCFLDANNDGRLDLATANGHVNDLRPLVPYAMPAQLLLNTDGRRLQDVTSRAGDAWALPRLGRGLACGDLDNDGRLDVLIVSEGGPLGYLHNEGPAGHFLTLKLEGSTSNREAIGARVTLTSGGARQIAMRHGGGSFLSADDSRIHFGLGSAAHASAIEVRWPSGRVDRHTDLVGDAAYLLREGDHPARKLQGWRRR